MPSHPELLDALALHLRDHGGSLKDLIRAIVSSETFQRSSQPTTRPANPQAQTLLAHYPLQRLDAEGYVVYERYRGVTMTEAGREIGRAIARRHEVLTRLLAGFGLDPQTVHEDVEGMEHHISRQTLDVLTLLMEELEANAELLERLKRKLARG